MIFTEFGDYINRYHRIDAASVERYIASNFDRNQVRVIITSVTRLFNILNNFS